MSLHPSTSTSFVATHTFIFTRISLLTSFPHSRGILTNISSVQHPKNLHTMHCDVAWLFSLRIFDGSPLLFGKKGHHIQHPEPLKPTPSLSLPSHLSTQGSCHTHSQIPLCKALILLAIIQNLVNHIINVYLSDKDESSIWDETTSILPLTLVQMPSSQRSPDQ